MSYSALSIGIGIFILAFFMTSQSFQDLTASIFTPELVPAQTQTSSQSPSLEAGAFCQTVTEADAPTFKAPRDDVSKAGWDDQDRSDGELVRDPEGCGGDRHLFRGETTYRLIRKNVPLTTTDVKEHDYNWDDSSCHFDTAEKLGINIPEVDTSKYKVFFPEISGEISLDRLLYSRTRGGDRDLMYFIDYGLVFLLHINPDGSLTELKGGTTQGQSETFVLADIYQDIESDRPELPPEALSCDTTQGAAIASGTQVIIPEQGSATDSSQLQLKYFVFGSNTSSGSVVNGWGIHCKPAVYLYPPQKQLVNVQVFPKGELSYTDPPYDPKTGWTVIAYPDGSLYETISHPLSAIRNYPYLYYESKILDSEIEKPKTGWMVKPSDMENLFNTILPKLGLNNKEAKDFKDYWLNKLPDSPYYFVGLIEKPQRDYLEALKVTPNPDTSIRFSLYFEMLDQPKTVSEPLINTPKRDGFTLVDWGGMMKLHPGTAFTCSE